MKILKFAGAFLYGALMAYLMWLLFYWITPIAMLIGWGWFIVYLFVAGGFISMLVGSISYLLVIPIVKLSQGCKAAAYAPIPFLLFFGYSSVRLPWSLNMDYGVFQWVIGISLSITIVVAFISLIVAPIKNAEL